MFFKIEDIDFWFCIKKMCASFFEAWHIFLTLLHHFYLMKKSSLAICVAAVTLFSIFLPFAATAATPIDSSEAKGLVVTGGISPGSCAINFAGAFDYGTLSSSLLDAASEGGTILNERRLARKQLQINCDASTQISVELIDSRSDSVAWFESSGVKIGGTFWFDVNVSAAAAVNLFSFYEPAFFGLGKNTEGVPAGVYIVAASLPKVDGKGALLFGVDGNGGIFKDSIPYGFGSDRAFLGNGKTLAWGDYSSSNPVALPGKIFSLQLQTVLAITNSKYLPLNKAIPLDGSSTLVVKYL